MGRQVHEKRLSIDEVIRIYDDGQLCECFGTGTAAVVAHIRRIRYRDRTLEMRAIEQRKVGPAVREELLRIMTGRILIRMAGLSI